MNPLDKLLALYYNNKACAKALEISEGRLANWVVKGFIPYKNGEMIEKKTGGKVPASSIYQHASKVKKNKAKG
jgi:hypothetical protein